MKYVLFIWLSVVGVAAWAQEIARPVIGVAGAGYISRSVRFSMASLWDAGAYPILLDTRQPEQVSTHVAAVNGVVIAGNSLDINPADYGAVAEAQTKNEDEQAQTLWDTHRDDYEYALIQAATERQLPFLGICSGAQRLNVAGGGTLMQHVDGQMVVSQTQLPHQPARDVHLVPSSQLAAIAMIKQVKENSLHHQHIDRVREGFRISAYDTKSGTAEAIEPTADGAYASQPFMMGVQWHPEYGASDVSRQLLQHFVAKAKAHAQQHPVAIAQAMGVDASPPPLRAMIEKGLADMREQYGYSQPPWVFQ